MKLILFVLQSDEWNTALVLVVFIIQEKYWTKIVLKYTQQGILIESCNKTTVDTLDIRSALIFLLV